MKSAIGIGALLLDGLGDTIRVSLTEDPELEIQPCRQLAVRVVTLILTLMSTLTHHMLCLSSCPPCSSTQLCQFCACSLVAVGRSAVTVGK